MYKIMFNRIFSTGRWLPQTLTQWSATLDPWRFPCLTLIHLIHPWEEVEQQVWQIVVATRICMKVGLQDQSWRPLPNP